jgi:hypothetical protein
MTQIKIENKLVHINTFGFQYLNRKQKHRTEGLSDQFDFITVSYLYKHIEVT